MEGLNHGLAQRAWRGTRKRRLGNQERIDDARQHEQRGHREHALPRKMIGEDQRQRSRNQARDAIRLHMNRVAESKLEIRQQFPAVRVEHDVLCGSKKGDCGSEIGDGPQVELRLKRPEKGNRYQQRNLCRQHPAAPSAEYGERVAIDQR